MSIKNGEHLKYDDRSRQWRERVKRGRQDSRTGEMNINITKLPEMAALDTAQEKFIPQILRGFSPPQTCISKALLKAW